MRLSDISSRFIRSRTSSAVETNPTAKVQASSHADHPVSSPESSCDVSEKILSCTEPWPTPRTTSETVSQARLPGHQLDQSSSLPTSVEWFALVGQDCNACHGPCARMITRSSNRNGNAGRPYYKCLPCDKFIRFDDARGVDQGTQGNPLCHCGQSSRRQITSREKGRRIFYVCTIGTCLYFEWHRNEDGSQWSVGEDVVTALQRLQVV